INDSAGLRGDRLMPVRKSQGAIRPMPPERDELLAGVPGRASPAPPRRDDGTLLPGPSASEFARRGAQAQQENRKARALLGAFEPDENHAFAGYMKVAREWRHEHAAQLAQAFGGGSLDAGAASVLASAALQLAASRYLFDLGATNGDSRMLLEASKLANDSRQNLLSAQELCAKTAKALHGRKAPNGRKAIFTTEK